MDQLGEALSGAATTAGNLGGQALGGIESGIGDIGKFIGGIPGDIGGLLGGQTGSGSPASPTSAGTAAAASGGSPAAMSTPSMPTTGASAAGAAAAAPGADLSGGGVPDILNQITSGGGSGGAAGLLSATGGGAGGSPGAGITTPDLTPAANPLAGVTPNTPNVGAITPPGGAGGGLGPLLAKYGLPAGALGLSIAQATSTSPAEKAEKQQLATEQGQAKMLAPAIAAEQQGKLPQGAQALIDQQLQKTQAQIRSQYAASGLTGSSAERQDLEAAAQSAQAQAFQIGNQMASQGITQLTSADSQAGSLLSSILNSETQSDEQLQQLMMKLGGLAVTPSTQASVTAGG